MVPAAAPLPQARAVAESAVSPFIGKLATYDNTITLRGLFTASSCWAKVWCTLEGAFHYTTARGEEGTVVLEDFDAFHVRRRERPRGKDGEPAGFLRTPAAHSAGAREWCFRDLSMCTLTVRQRRGRTVKRRQCGIADDAKTNCDQLVFFKADGKRASIRELSLPPGLELIIERRHGVPPPPPRADPQPAIRLHTSNNPLRIRQANCQLPPPPQMARVLDDG